eukprot:CAMPEP_0180712358 /NCGR_PEP_ID=MMETSP1038_2-20121128/11334_1 /TAXON_ID=632150 /ORGANISM="Azadinium spinosum, Strain 3D9" /LENGTH=59 /DNA_ID=CAMNT_0022744627 /DNA_START=201 /DNA_END=380 /DNA_ORIENTATION=+
MASPIDRYQDEGEDRASTTELQPQHAESQHDSAVEVFGLHLLPVPPSLQRPTQGQAEAP